MPFDFLTSHPNGQNRSLFLHAFNYDFLRIWLSLFRDIVPLIEHSTLFFGPEETSVLMVKLEHLHLSFEPEHLRLQSSIPGRDAHMYKSIFAVDFHRLNLL